ncbi:MAG: head-tail connector protein [Patescibacteria group bacterium]|nr:head-tail connector protein [Patescibacteria group bacterium]
MVAKTYDIAHYVKAAPSLLAMQGSDVAYDTDSKKDTKQWNELRSHLEQRLVSLRMWRQSWWSLNWSNIAEFILPRRSIMLTQSVGGIPSPNNMVRGQPLNNSIINPHATYCVRVCAAGLMNGLASPSRKWFKFTPASNTGSIDADGRAWIDEVETRIYTVLGRSNFYNAFAQECEDLVAFGTAPCVIYEDEKDVIRCYVPTVGEYYLGVDASGRVDTLYRQFVMTIEQAISFFGAEKSSDEIKALWNQKGTGLDKERIIAHAIEPNFGIGKDDAGKLPDTFTWREVYWVWGSGAKQPLSVRGFKDTPFTAMRWATQSNDAYGRSPGMDVLPDVMQLQHECRKKAEAIEKQVNPPLIADVTMKNQPSSSIPGDVTYVPNLSATEGMRPMYVVNPDINAMMQDIKMVEDRISRGLFNDLFLLLSENPVNRQTAYEVSQKVQEKMQILGPVIENIISEGLKLKLERVLSIMKRRGFIPPPPDSMKDTALDIEFVSMLNLAQKGTATGGLERIVGLIGNMAAVYPEAKDNLDPDIYINTMNDLLGNTQKILRDKNQVAAIRQQQMEAMKQQQQMEAAQHMAQTTKIGADAANVLSNTSVGSGASALSQLIGQ